MTQIVQKKLFNPTQEIRLTEDDFVAVTTKRLLSERTFRFALQDVDPDPSRQKSISRNAVALALVFGFLTLTGLIPALTDADPAERVSYVTSAVFWGALTLGAGLYAGFTRSDLHVYFQRYSGKAILALHHHQPTPAASDAFRTALNMRLDAVHARNRPAAAAAPAQREYRFSPN